MKYASTALESSAALPSVEFMSAAEIQAELRHRESDGVRRQALWQRLDILAAEGRLDPKPEPTVPPAEGRRALRAPDLQELVRKRGGYHLITSEDWRAHDQAMETYRADYRARIAAERRAGWTSKK
jgi:hypothetical protein